MSDDLVMLHNDLKTSMHSVNELLEAVKDYEDKKIIATMLEDEMGYLNFTLKNIISECNASK